MSGSASSFRSNHPLPTREQGSGSATELFKATGEGASSPADKEPTVISTRAPMEMAATPALPAAATIDRLGPGTRIANYELLECVGGGGMGQVFRARDTALARIVALKVLTPEQTADGEILLRFRNEAQTAARLNHESVVQVYHTGEDRGVAYIAFEFIEGMNVRALVEKRGVLPLDEALRYTYQVAEALAHAAAHNVVHRDIKPSNILITSEGQAKLIDLGLARLYKTGEDADDLTASGVTLGTFDYISPEQARDPRTADVRSDIYSLGCTLFFMLTGRPPFVEGTVLQKLLQHQGEEPPDVRQFRPELPAAVSRLLRKMMAKDPRRRFRDPHQLLDALVLLAEEVGMRPSSPGDSRWTAHGRPDRLFWQRHLPWIAPAAVLALAVLSLHFLWSPVETSPEPMPLISLGLEQAGMPPEPLQDSAPRPAESPTLPGGSEAGEARTAEQRPVETAPRSTGPSAPTAETASRETGSAVGDANDTPLPAAVSNSSLPRSDPHETNVLAAASSPSGAAPIESQAAAGVKVVDPTATGPDVYPTLAAACAAANTGDIVALRYNGARAEGPLTLRNLRLTIRAADGFQPVVVFRPGQWEPLQRSNAMLSLVGSQLTMIRVSLVLEVPREAAADRWSLIESCPAETIRLEKCWLSINNASAQMGAYHPDVAFFRIQPGPNRSVLPRDPPSSLPRLSLELVDCFLRGEAVVLAVHDQAAMRFSWDNGLLATQDRLLVALGGERTPSAGEGIQLSLSHLTAFVRGGLCRFAASAAGSRLLPVQIDCRNSILIGDSTAAMVEHVDVGDVESVQQGFAWNGERNFYEGFGNFWTIRPSGDSSETMSVDAWREYWGTQREHAPQGGRVQWKQFPPPDRPVSSHTPADYALSPSSAAVNPAIGAANDGRDVGCLFDRLPPMAAALPTASPPAAVEPRDSASAAPLLSAP